MRLAFTGAVAAGLLAITALVGSGSNDATADPLVNVHVHGTNLARTQVHVHHVVHNVRVLDDGSIEFEIEN